LRAIWRWQRELPDKHVVRRLAARLASILTNANPKQ